MKYIKMLGLAAVAAMALMAFLGASSASATVLCTTPETSGCAASKWDYPAGTEIHATLKTGTKAVLNASGIKDECSESTVKGVTANTGSSTETVHGEVTVANLTWGGCTAEKTETVAGGELEIHWIEGTDNGTVTAKKVGVTVKSAGISCTYGAGEGIHLGTLTGGNPATISISTTVFVTGGFLCPSTATWTAQYVVTKPTPLYVSTN